jgi:septum site-determining protein MinD
MPCISVASGKGGVGKSIICANLGVALSELGYSVALVDADIEGATLGLLLGYNLEDDATLHDYLSGNATEEEVLKSVSPMLNVVFGSVQLTALMKELNLERLERLTSWLKERHDLVLIDTPPGFEEDTFAAIKASDAVIIILNPDILSVTGALKVRIVAKREGKRILGVVVNKAGHEYDIPTEELEAFLEEEVLAVIKDDPLVRNSLLEGIPLVSSYPDSPASRGIKELAKRVMEKLTQDKSQVSGA